MFQLVSRTFAGAKPSLVAIVLTLVGLRVQSQGFLEGFPTAAPVGPLTTVPPADDDTQTLFPSLDDISDGQTINAAGTLTFGDAPAASPSGAAPSVTAAPAAAPAAAVASTGATQDASGAYVAAPPNSASAAAAPSATVSPVAAAPVAQASATIAPVAAAPVAQASATVAPAAAAPVAPAVSPPSAPSSGTTAASVVSSAQVAVTSPVSETYPAAATSTVATDVAADAPANPSISLRTSAAGPASGTSPSLSVADDLSAFRLCKASSRRLDTSQEQLTSRESQRRLAFTFLTGVDPLELIQQSVVTVLIIICLIFLYRNRTQVTILLTGDDRLHTSFLDCVWTGCFRCCGLCNHEWSRWLTSMPCFPASWRGTNFVKTVGSKLGVATRSIELSNLVVGDLPFYRRASFYLAVECSQNPPMRTAVQDDKQPKTVHFPEVLTLRIRDSMLDTLVTITVYQLHVVGSNPLCQVRLSPSNIMDWALDDKPENRYKRFAMKVIDDDNEVETPPWISLEFGRPSADVRHLDEFHGNATHTVRTATDGLDATTQLPYRDLQMADFKGEYRLVDQAGNAVNEPDENQLGKLTFIRNLIVCVYSLLSTILILAALAWAGFRYYVKNCYDKFRVMTTAKSWTPHSFPMPSCALRSIEQECADKMKGTGIDEGEDMCRPTDDIVEQVCENPPQTRPRAFEYIADDFDVPWATAPCFHGICRFRNKVIHYDTYVCSGLGVLLVLVLCCFRPLANKCLRDEKTRVKAESNTALHTRSVQSRNQS